mgnify:CR=1 FL=1
MTPVLTSTPSAPSELIAFSERSSGNAARASRRSVHDNDLGFFRTNGAEIVLSVWRAISPMAPAEFYRVGAGAHDATKVSHARRSVASAMRSATSNA